MDRVQLKEDFLFLVSNREQLCELSFRYEKFIKDEIFRKNGAKNIHIDHDMIKAYKESYGKYRTYLEEEKKKKKEKEKNL